MLSINLGTQTINIFQDLFSSSTGYAYLSSDHFKFIPKCDRCYYNRLAHKSSFWARSATVSAKRDRTSAERERASAKRERAKARAGSYHTRPENQANDFEKVYYYKCDRYYKVRQDRGLSYRGFELPRVKLQ